MLDVVLGSVLDVCQLLANTRQNDVFWCHAMLQHQAHFSLRKKDTHTHTHHRNRDFKV